MAPPDSAHNENTATPRDKRATSRRGHNLRSNSISEVESTSKSPDKVPAEDSDFNILLHLDGMSLVVVPHDGTLIVKMAVTTCWLGIPAESSSLRTHLVK